MFEDAGIHQRELLAYIFKEYNPLERPVENDANTLNVSVGLSVQQLVHLVHDHIFNRLYMILFLNIFVKG